MPCNPPLRVSESTARHMYSGLCLVGEKRPFDDAELREEIDRLIAVALNKVLDFYGAVRDDELTRDDPLSASGRLSGLARDRLLARLPVIGSDEEPFVRSLEEDLIAAFRQDDFRISGPWGELFYANGAVIFVAHPRKDDRAFARRRPVMQPS